MTEVDVILARLAGLYPREIDLSLSRVRGLLARLDDPQERLPPVVHVAGTNGKGSTIAVMRACLEAAGYRVHVYTSPHLVSPIERIRLAGILIDEGRMARLLEEVESKNNGDPITVFEVLTAAAFLAFAREPADILLLETGMGGRLDATNTISQPLVTAITPVSMDHMAFLGDKVEQIAGEKAGILKQGRPAVTGPQAPEALAVIERRAEALHAPLFRHGAEWRADLASPGGTDAWRFTGTRWDYTLPLPALTGRHQIDNAGLALACLEQLANFEIDEAAIHRGLNAVDWPARLQRLESGVLADRLPPGWSLWLDGGHNAAAGEVLAAMAATWSAQPLDMVIGMLNTREPIAFIRPLAGFARQIYTVTIPDEPHAHSADYIASHLAAHGIAATPAASVPAALEAAMRLQPGQPARILITGSLYLVGHVLAEERTGGGNPPVSKRDG